MNKNNEYLKSKTISYQHLLIELFFNGKLIIPVFIEIYMIPPCIPHFIWDLRKIVVIYFVVGKALNAFMKYPIRIWFDVMKHVIIIHDNNNADSYCSASIKGNLNVSYDAHNLLILWFITYDVKKTSGTGRATMLHFRFTKRKTRCLNIICQSNNLKTS